MVAHASNDRCVVWPLLSRIIRATLSVSHCYLCEWANPRGKKWGVLITRPYEHMLFQGNPKRFFDLNTNCNGDGNCLFFGIFCAPHSKLVMEVNLKETTKGKAASAVDPYGHTHQYDRKCAIKSFTHFLLTRLKKLPWIWFDFKLAIK